MFFSAYVAIVRGYRDIVVGSRDESGALRRTAYLRDVVVSSAAAKEIRVFGLTDLFLGRFLDSWRATRRDLARARFDSEWQP
jgi:ATP-binding cassette subfamily B protein